eukprot:TRINITY_DN779_c0_g2_i1.p1 TRINITY_DN779_c0_g2~~TRINITY_DN779_c0_g2_i1.p1  ORF type:complete len:345 (+),score=79.37 TRINITY_DN779_c0_g2_i1:218-1252(+)
MTGKASSELLHSLGRTLHRHTPLLLNSFANINSISYLDLYRFFKFMNVLTFRFESPRLEAYLSNYVQGLFHKDSLEEFFQGQGAKKSARNRSRSLRRRSSIMLDKQGEDEKSFSLYLQYYQHKFALSDFVKILIDLVFNVYEKSVQKELIGLKVMAKRTEMQNNTAKVLDEFLKNCASIASKGCYKNPLKRLSEEVHNIIAKEYPILIEMFYITIQRRFRRVAVNKTNPGYLLLIAPDDCYLLMTETVSSLGLAKEKFKEIMSIVIYESDYTKYLSENYELNSKGLLSFFDFVEFLYLASQYTNPNVLKDPKDKFLHLVKNVLYPALKKKSLVCIKCINMHDSL